MPGPAPGARLRGASKNLSDSGATQSLANHTPITVEGAPMSEVAFLEPLPEDLQ